MGTRGVGVGTWQRGHGGKEGKGEAGKDPFCNDLADRLVTIKYL